LKKDDEVTRRFVKYMANLILFNSINYDKKRRTIANRFPLTLDNEEGTESVLLSVYDSESVPPNLKDHITDHSLYKAYESLSEQQQLILSFSYVQGLKDKEIARKLGVSQQNISKQRLKALSKLRGRLEKG
jgi:RNA polymerase sigma factor (sigma-70 family)